MNTRKKVRSQLPQPSPFRQPQILLEYQPTIRYINNAVNALNNELEFLRLAYQEVLQLNANEIRRRQSLAEIEKKHVEAKEKKEASKQ